MSKRIFLLDGHSLAHRAFYALPLLTNSEGEYTNAVFGFARMLFKLIDDEDPDYLAVAFDMKGPTFRHQEYEEYKATRKKMPDELHPQIKLIKDVLTALNIPYFQVEEYEADDVIGTLARKAEDAGMEVNVVTGDRDALQLVNDNINVIYTRKGITDIVKYDLDKVKEKYELDPEQLVDMKGLMGDSSDNIPGVPGIGEKTATKLLKKYSNMEAILDNIEEISGEKRRENLHNYTEQAILSKRLGKIVDDVSFDIDLEDCRCGEPAHEQIVELFKNLEFNSLLDRFEDDSRETIGEEDIDITQLQKKEEIEKLLASIRNTGRAALDLLLTDYQNPVKSDMVKLIITPDGEEIFFIDKENISFDQFKSILEDRNIKKYILHAKETVIYFKRKGIELKGLKFDPLLASYLLHPSENLSSLEELFANELNLVIMDEVSPEKHQGYLVSSLFAIEDRLTEKIKEKKVLNLYNEIELPLIKVLAEMECNGIKVNVDYLNKLSDKWEQQLSSITEKVYQLAGEKFNLNSPQQLGQILFEKLGLPVIKKTKTGYSTSIDVLNELEDRHEIIPLIKEYRQGAKFKSTYVDALPPLINEESGRLHTSFNQMVTATGRLSSTEPNLQNIPIRTEEGREIRKAFVPGNEGWLLLAADYSQVELRVLAHISGDEGLTGAFNSGEDIHTQTASEIFEVEPEAVTSNMRREAKVINFGIAYGMSAYGLASDLDISRKEAEAYIEKYFERFSGVKAYMDDIIQQAGEKGYVTTIFNRRRYLPEIHSRNYHRRSFAERTAVNTPIQGSAADIMKLAMIEVYEHLQQEDYQARLLLQVHDELVLEVAGEDLAQVAAIVKEEMEGAVDLDVPLIVDLQIGENWRDKRDYRLR